MKAYLLSRSVIVIFLVMLLAITGIGVAVLLPVALSSRMPPPPRGMLLVWLAVIGWIWYIYLKIPYKITRLDDGRLEFLSVFKRTVVAPGDLISIKAVPFSLGFLMVRHKEGKIRLITQMTGLYELLYTLKNLNPQLEIRGC